MVLGSGVQTQGWGHTDNIVKMYQILDNLLPTPNMFEKTKCMIMISIEPSL